MNTANNFPDRQGYRMVNRRFFMLRLGRFSSFHTAQCAALNIIERPKQQQKLSVNLKYRFGAGWRAGENAMK
jgi:hypothetical protein